MMNVLVFLIHAEFKTLVPTSTVATEDCSMRMSYLGCACQPLLDGHPMPRGVGSVGG